MAALPGLSRCAIGFVLLVAGAAAGERVVGPADDLDEAFDGLAPGDAVILEDGTWKDVEIRVRAEGTPENPVVVRARTPGGTVLTGASRLRISGRHVVVSGLYFRDVSGESEVIAFRTSSRDLAEHCRLTGCAIVNGLDPGGRVESKWISLYGTGNRVDHCYLAGKENRGTTLVVWVGDAPNGHRIDHNHFGPRPKLDVNGGETIRVGTSDVSLHESRTLVERNLFTACDGEAEIVSGKSCDNVYRENTFDRCSGALTLRHGNRSLVERNLFLGRGKNGAGGVRIIGEDHRVLNNHFADLPGDDHRSTIGLMNGIPDGPLNGYAPVTRAVVAFNTIVDCKVPVAIGVGAGRTQSVPPTDCVIANNVVAGRARARTDEVEAPGLDWRGNLLAKSAAELALERDAGGLWRPTEKSPARGAAVGDVAGIEVDVDGEPRAEPFDVGCDQWGNTPTSRPLTPADVGPSWFDPLERTLPLEEEAD